MNVAQKEEIKSPSRYKDNGDMECIETIFGAGFGEAFCAGSVMKYLRRYKQKGGVADLDKAIQYIEFMKAYFEGGMYGLHRLTEELANPLKELKFDYDSLGLREQEPSPDLDGIFCGAGTVPPPFDLGYDG